MYNIRHLGNAKTKLSKPKENVLLLKRKVTGIMLSSHFP